MKTNVAILALLSLGCAGRTNDMAHSTLLVSQCRRSAASDANPAISVRIDPERAVTQYLQVTVFAIRSAEPDSVVAHAVGDPRILGTLPPGLYRLRVRSLGYQTAIDTVHLPPGASCVVTARLVPAYPLAPALP